MSVKQHEMFVASPTTERRTRRRSRTTSLWEQWSRFSSWVICAWTAATHMSTAVASGSSSASSGSTNPIFADTSSNAYYDGYQQAWRMLGIYVDCTGLTSLETDASGNQQQQQQEQQHSNDNNNNNGACQRYLLWEAYIDGNYQGNSIGEYQYYNVETQRWDDSACALTSSQRCAKLDCHLPYSSTAAESDTATTTADSTTTTTDSTTDSTSGTTNATAWQLLGVYKERYYASEWFEQLFKHAGYCLWNNYTTYSFMQTYYNAWPENGCVATGHTDVTTGHALYVDLAPGPTLRLALYTDTACYAEVSPTLLTSTEVDTILQASGYLGSAAQYTFNQHLLQFAVCQPCRAFNLANTNNQNNRQRHTTTTTTHTHDERTLDNDYSNDPNYPLFACYDDAGYTNVNQCMKFRTHTTLQPASLHDIQTALVQGAMLHVRWGGDDTVVYSPLVQHGALHGDESVAASLSLLAAATNVSSSSYVSRISSSSKSSSTGTTVSSSWWFLSLASGSVLVAAALFGGVLVWKWDHIHRTSLSFPQDKDRQRRRRRQQKKQQNQYSSRFARRAMLNEPLVAPK